MKDWASDDAVIGLASEKVVNGLVILDPVDICIFLIIVMTLYSNAAYDSFLSYCVS